MISNKAVSNTLLWMQHFFQLDAKDNIAQKTSISFTDSIWEIFLPLITGAKSVIIDAKYFVNGGEAIYTTYCMISEMPGENQKLILIGVPIANTKVYIYDACLHPCDIA